jgi:hypothetical protein
LLAELLDHGISLDQSILEQCILVTQGQQAKLQKASLLVAVGQVHLVTLALML